MTTATAKLNTALITMASRGGRPRCADPVDHALWTSEDQHDRDIAGVCGVAATAASDQEERGRHERRNARNHDQFLLWAPDFDCSPPQETAPTADEPEPCSIAKTGYRFHCHVSQSRSKILLVV
jgi:hypothetical protein